MARVAIVVRIIPADSNVNLDELSEKIKAGLPGGIELKEARKEPLAFGMSVLQAAFTAPEEEGSTDKLEEFLKSFPEVEDIEVVMVSRL